MCRFTLALMIVMLAGSSAGAVDSAPAAGPAPDTRTTVADNNRFALELYVKLRAAEGNLFFSPYSISTALAMTYAGARDETAVEMARVMHFDSPPDRLHLAMGALIRDLNEGGKKGGYQLAVANALWGAKGEEFRKEYIDLVQASYGGALRTLDFDADAESARRTINGWVEDNTAHKIKDLIPSKGAIQGAKLVLTNAIYFKGNWAALFKADQTKAERFTLIDARKVDAPLMHQTGKFLYTEDNDCQLLEMPYAGDDDVVMTILLPRKLDGLAALEKSLEAGSLQVRLAKRAKREAVVTLPKFKVTSTFQLNEALGALGMQRAFRGGFTGMTVKGDLFIGPVLHKAFVDVNEEGTEAAAATGVVMMTTSVGPRPGPVVFRADHPFLFLIRHARTESILFIGRLMTPEG